MEEQYFDDTLLSNDLDDILCNLQQTIIDEMEDFVDELREQWDTKELKQYVQSLKEHYKIEAVDSLLQFEQVREAFLALLPEGTKAKYVYGKVCFTVNGIKYRLNPMQAIEYLKG